MTKDTADHWPIFVLSLKDATARRAALLKALDDRGLRYTIFDAVDGRGGLTPEDETRIDRPGTVETFGRPMSDTEYACALSHLGIYRQIVDRDLPGAIVFEDDAILTPLFDGFMAAKGYLVGDLVQMDHIHGDIWRSESPHKLTDRISLARAARNVSLTTGYSISAVGARYFLDQSLPLRRSADWPADPTAIGALLCLPRVIDHPPFETGSALEAGRAALQASRTMGPRALRFFCASYWRRWWFKRRTRRIS